MLVGMMNRKGCVTQCSVRMEGVRRHGRSWERQGKNKWKEDRIVRGEGNEVLAHVRQGQEQDMSHATSK